MVVEYPLACNNLAKEAEIIPFPSDEATPPVTKTYLVEFDIYKICNYGEQSYKNTRVI